MRKILYRSFGNCETSDNMQYQRNFLSFEDFYYLCLYFSLREELVVLERGFATQLVSYKD